MDFENKFWSKNIISLSPEQKYWICSFGGLGRAIFYEA
jgi:hypothetical protein